VQPGWKSNRRKTNTEGKVKVPGKVEPENETKSRTRRQSPKNEERRIGGKPKRRAGVYLFLPPALSKAVQDFGEQGLISCEKRLGKKLIKP